MTTLEKRKRQSERDKRARSFRQAERLCRKTSGRSATRFDPKPPVLVKRKTLVDATIEAYFATGI